MERKMNFPTPEEDKKKIPPPESTSEAEGVPRPFWNIWVNVGIILCVIVLLAIVAVPMLLRERISANEGAAIGALRAIATAEAQFT